MKRWVALESLEGNGSFEEMKCRRETIGEEGREREREEMNM